MAVKLERSFYRNSDVSAASRDLLGKVLSVADKGIISKGVIVETEAYSFREKACHAFNERRTARTETLFADGGTSYVYLCYGIHCLFNIVTNVENVAEAVLIRAVEPLEGIEEMRFRRKIKNDLDLTSGPGKLTKAMGISLLHNSRSLTENDIWVEDHGIEVAEVVSGPRIGVDYAGEDALLPWRYGISGNPFLSRPFPE